MGKPMDYHTALRPPVAPTDTIYGDATIKRYDVLSQEALPIEFAQCDVFYSEPPWQLGFETFERRAGIGGRKYNDFLAAISKIVLAVRAPVVLISGKHAVSRLPEPQVVSKSKINGAECLALFYRMGSIKGKETEILASLAARFDCVGDFCAGYGRTGKAFLEAGKRAVLSDYNAECVRVMNERFRSR